MSPLHKKARNFVTVFIVTAIAIASTLSINPARAQEGTQTPVPPAIGSGSAGTIMGKFEEAKPSMYPVNPGRSVRPAGQSKTSDPNAVIQAPPIATTVDRTLHFKTRLFPSTGSFNIPFMMTYDNATSYVFVSDYNNNRVLVYDNNNNFVRQIGSSSFYNGPGGIVADSLSDSIYIADCGGPPGAGGGRIVKFNYLGSFLTTIGSGLGCPTGLAYNPIDGNLYVVETTNNRVHKYSLAGADQGTIGGPGSGNGQFNTPYGIAIDQTYGYTYVADSGNNRIQKFYTGGAFARIFGTSGSTPGFTASPEGLAIDKAGLLYVADTNNNRIQKFDNLGTFRGQYSAQGGTCGGTFLTTCNGYFTSVRGVAVSGSGDVYTADGGSNIVQRFGAAMQPTGRFNVLATSSGFNSIGGIAVDSYENIYATDVNNKRIQKFDKFGAFITSWGSDGIGNGQFKQPIGIAIDNTDTIFVTDGILNRVQKFNTSGGYLGQFGSTGAGNGQFSGASAIAVDNQGFVYVTEESNHRVQKLDTAGNFSRKWGSAGTGGGQFQTPTGIAIDENRGFVWVTEYGNNRMQLFTVYGDFIQIVPASTSGTCALLQPVQVATDQRGNVLVADRGHNQVALFNESGRCFGVTASTDAQSITISRKNGQAFTGGGSLDNLLRRVGAPSTRTDTTGVWRPSTNSFYLRNSNSGGSPDITVTITNTTSNDLPITGDWNNDGVDTVGMYRTTTGFFYLFDRNINQDLGQYNYLVLLGNPGDQPLSGDWDADGKDGVGTFRPSNGILYLRNALTTGVSDYFMVLGNPSDSGVAGDWNGDGVFSAGIFRPSESRFHLSDRNSNGIVFGDYAVYLGTTGDVPFAGDWVAQGSSGIGTFRPSTGVMYLKNTLVGGSPDISFAFGAAGDIPVSGYWGTPPALPDEFPNTPRKEYVKPPIIVYGGSGNTDQTGGSGD